MIEIRCSSELHAALGRVAERKPSSRQDAPARLGNWAAILGGRALVIAIEERTCLTLVFRLKPVAGLRNRLDQALRQALLTCGVSPDAIESECEAIRGASFVRRRHPALVDALEFAEEEGMSHAELGQSEVSVQDMLNEFPYGECPASCPKEAVRLRFGGRTSPDRRRPTVSAVHEKPRARR